MVSCPQAGLFFAFFERGQDRCGFVAGFDDLAAAEIFFGVVEGVEDHAFDLLVGQAVAGLHLNFGFLAAALLARGDVQDAVGVDEELYFDARNSGRHRRNAFEIEARQRAAVRREFALALQDVDGDVSLAVDLRGVELRGRGRDGRVAQNDFVGDSTGDFDAERQRRDVEQQHVLGGFRAAAENVGLHGRAQRDHFVGIQIGVRFALEHLFHQGANLRDARGAADKHDFVDLFGLEARVFHRLLARADGAVDDGLNQLLVLFAGDFALVALAAGKFDIELHRRLRRKRNLGVDDGLADRLNGFGVATQVETRCRRGYRRGRW